MFRVFWVLILGLAFIQKLQHEFPPPPTFFIGADGCTVSLDDGVLCPPGLALLQGPLLEFPTLTFPDWRWMLHCSRRCSAHAGHWNCKVLPGAGARSTISHTLLPESSVHSVSSQFPLSFLSVSSQLPQQFPLRFATQSCATEEKKRI